MRLLFVSAQLPGHLDWGGYLQTAAALAQRGHELLWVSGAEVEAQVLHAGVPFHAVAETGWRWPPPSPLPRGEMTEAAWAAARARRAMDQWLDVARVATAAAELEAVAAAFRPHLIVTEHFVAAAALVAERLDLRLVVAGWPAYAQQRAAQPFLQALEEDFQARIALWRSDGRYFTKCGQPGIESPYLHITYWSPGWYAAPDAPPLGAQTRHVGGQAPPSKPPPAGFPAPDVRPWIFITLGTAFNRDPAFFAAAAHAAEAVGAQPIVATGALPQDDTDTLRRRLPASTLMRPTVDFAALLPYTAAAIHHGGAGTTHALVTHAVPQIVVPHAGDQLQQALSVARTGIGLHMPPRAVTTQTLAEALADLLPATSAPRLQANRLRAEFAAGGGTSLAADLLEEQAVATQPT